MPEPQEPDENQEFEERLKLVRRLRHPDLNLLDRVSDHDEAIEVHNEKLEEHETKLLNFETRINILESYGHVTGKKLTEIRARALTTHFIGMKINLISKEKSMTSGEMIDFFENDAPEFLRIYELKNPHKAMADVRKKCIQLYPKNYSTRKSKHGQHPWILVFKD